MAEQSSAKLPLKQSMMERHESVQSQKGETLQATPTSHPVSVRSKSLNFSLAAGKRKNSRKGGSKSKSNNLQQFKLLIEKINSM